MEMINSETFEATIASGIVLVDFYADWCGPCKMLTPIMEELDKELTNVNFVKVDVDQEQELSRRYGIQAIPNLIIFKDGKAVDQITGFTSKKELVSRLQLQF